MLSASDPWIRRIFCMEARHASVGDPGWCKSENQENVVCPHFSRTCRLEVDLAQGLALDEEEVCRVECPIRHRHTANQRRDVQVQLLVRGGWNYPENNAGGDQSIRSIYNPVSVDIKGVY